MKTLLFTLLFAIISNITFGENLIKNTTKATPTIMVVGFNKQNLTSNYYGLEFLSKELGISTDSLHIYFYHAIIEKLSSMSNLNFKTDNNSEFQISKIMDNDYSNLLINHDSKYLLHINQYQMNWSGEPFNTIMHLLNYTLFDENRTPLLSGQMFIDSDELNPFKTEKKAEKKMKILAQKIERAVDK